MNKERDHGGGIDAAIAEFGGVYSDWIDLSTGINPAPYPIPDLPSKLWTDLPDKDMISGLEHAARRFWNVPEGAEVVATPGASATIASLPKLFSGRSVNIPQPTYNEHAAAFIANGWATETSADTLVIVNPNNPDGRLWTKADTEGKHCIIDESFCDVTPDASLIALARTQNYVVLKSFGKFWGLAGLRLGFAICLPEFARTLREALGPWAVSGPACHIGTLALNDETWANETRIKLANSSDRLDALLKDAGFKLKGGTSLFRLVACDDAKRVHHQLAKNHILTRVFPYSRDWVRFGIPGDEADWNRLNSALKQLS